MTESSEPDLYNEFYYKFCCGMPYARTQAWLDFFGGIAERIVQDIGPSSALDAGCAMGFLVESLCNRGVDAYGIDLSEYAIQRVHEDIRSRCWVGSLLNPLPRRYDLIICMEVLEHLSKSDCEHAVDNLCAASDDILFSSTPDDYHEPTHMNVQQPDYWTELFARRGFWHDLDFNASFVNGWAMRFHKAAAPVYRQLQAYERRLWSATREESAARQLALEYRIILGERDVKIGELETKNAELDREKQRLAMPLQGNEHTATDQQNRQALEAALVQERAQKEALVERLRGMEAGFGWKMIEKIGPAHQKLFPPESRRGRVWHETTKWIAARLKL